MSFSIIKILAFFFLLFFFIFLVGVYDALQKKYLKTLMFCVCEAIEGPMIEEYACKIWYKLVH